MQRGRRWHRGLPGGRYLVGSLFIKDYVTLNLRKDAVLLGSALIEHYANPDAYVDGAGCRRGWASIIATDSHGVTIAGCRIDTGDDAICFKTTSEYPGT